MGGVHRIGQAVKLGHLFQRRKQGKADNIEQGDGAVAHIGDAIAFDDFADLNRRLAHIGVQFHKCRWKAKRLAAAVHDLRR